MRRFDSPDANAGRVTDLTPRGLLGLLLLVALVPAAGWVASLPLGAVTLAAAALAILAYRRFPSRTPAG